jgi:hypothetical protein
MKQLPSISCGMFAINRRKFALNSISLISLCFAPTWAQAQTINASLFHLESAMFTLEERATDYPAIVSQQHAAILRRKLEQLQELAATGVESGAEKSYSTSLDFEAALLDQAARSESASRVQTIMDNVIADLDLKIGLGKASLGGTSILKAKVHVTVRTVDANNHDIGGLIIGLSPFLYLRPTPMFFFSGPSSPTEGDFPPGRYNLINMRAKAETNPQTIEVGLAGQDKQNIRMLVE